MKMAKNPKDPLNNLLNAYQETVQWLNFSYDQLESLFRQPLYIFNALKESLFNICAEKLQHLINMETANIPEEDFDVSYALFLLQQHLVTLKTRMCAFTKPSEPLTAPATPVNDPQTQAKCSNEIEMQLREQINRAQVVPRLKGLQDIGGLISVKNSLAAIVVLPIHQPQLYVGQRICNSILLYGPPGTGKTQLVHALAAEASATFLSITASDILSHYVGQTEKLVRILFEFAKEDRSSSTILFMDEIDGLCRRRNDSEAEWNRRLKTELMCQLSAFEDHPKVFLICATNCPWDLDPAFLRRFQQRIYVPLPTRPDRFELLQLLTIGTPLEMTSNYWGDLLNRTEGYSGSDLADLVRYTLNSPIKELISNKRWKRIATDVYQPASDHCNFNEVIYCDLQELPPHSVQARQVQMTDLLAAVDVIKRTVSNATLQKYEEYISES